MSLQIQTIRTSWKHFLSLDGWTTASAVKWVLVFKHFFPSKCRKWDRWLVDAWVEQTDPRWLCRHLNVRLYWARFLPDSERKSTAVGSRRQRRIKIQKHYVIARCYTTRSLTTIRRVWRCRRRSETASRLGGTAAGLNLSTHLTHLFTCCEGRGWRVLTESKRIFELRVWHRGQPGIPPRRRKKKTPKKTALSAASVVLMSL